MVVETPTPEYYSKVDISNRSMPFKIAVTIALIALANLITFALQNFIGLGTSFLIYFGFIMLCGRFIGFWHSIICMIACGLIASVFFVIPYESFSISAAVKMLIYGIEGLFIVYFTDGIRKSLNAATLANNNFKMLISKSQDGLARLSKDGKILYISPSIENITGFNEYGLATQGFDIFPEEADRQEVTANFLKIINEPGQSVTFIHRYKNKKRERRWMETIFTNHLDIKGIHAVTANFRDVTERIEAEERKKDFMGIAAHEVKNPMTVVKLNAELQQIALENNNYQLVKKFNIVIQENTKKVFHLLEELMNFSGFESALLDLNFTKFNLRMAIDSAIVTFSASYKNEVRKEGELSTIVYGDRYRLEQVLVNLLSNAAKYSPDGSVITVNCCEAGNDTKVSIIDKGIGIPEKEIALLFNKFHRVRTTHNKTKGYGLGLYICAEIIKAHKGKIGVESKEHEGSVFWFSLPLSAESKV
jgi:PAS domain S-box-containing protein